MSEFFKNTLDFSNISDNYNKTSTNLYKKHLQNKIADKITHKSSLKTFNNYINKLDNKDELKQFNKLIDRITPRYNTLARLQKLKASEERSEKIKNTLEQKQFLQIEPPEIIAKPTRQARHTAFERSTNKPAITKRKYTKRKYTKNNNKPIQQEKPKNKYNLVVESTVNKEYKRRDNTYSKPYTEKVTQAKAIYANTIEEAKQIVVDESRAELEYVDSPVIASVVSTDVKSDVFIDDGGNQPVQ